MNRILSFAKLVFSAFWNFRYQIHIAALLIITILPSFTNAQSRDRDKPTPLTSNEISGLIDSETKGKFYYYSFVANPGEVSITLTVEPGRKANENDFIAMTAVGFSLFDRNAEEIAGKSVTTAESQGAKQAVARVEITRRQTVVLSINVPDAPYYKSVGGKYRIRIEGAAEFSQNRSTAGIGVSDPIVQEGIDQVRAKGKTDNPNCLPKQGTLIVKMKDGSKKIIDLSEAEMVTIVP
jgi:hypothetical protein